MEEGVIEERKIFNFDTISKTDCSLVFTKYLIFLLLSLV